MSSPPNLPAKASGQQASVPAAHAPQKPQTQQTFSVNSYFQALRVLNYICRQKKQPVRQQLRVMPELSASLAKPEVFGLDLAKSSMMSSELALYGAHSPLPFFYTEDLIEGEKYRYNNAKTLFDLFHARLHQINFDVVHKHKPLFSLVEQKQQHYVDLLYGFVGLRHRDLRAKWDDYGEVLRHMGLYHRRVRSAGGLKCLLKNVFPDYDVQIEQCVLRRIDIPKEHRFILGERKHSLGHGLVLGRYVRERRGRMRVSMRSTTVRLYENLLPDTAQWKKLQSLLRSYIDGLVECEIVVELLSKHLGRTVLGSKKRGALGASAWLTRKGKDMVVKRKFLLDYKS